MDCKYSIKIKPIIDGDSITVSPYHGWLHENNIKRWRGGEWPPQAREMHPNDIYVVFRFADKEDVTAFKLMWSENL